MTDFIIDHTPASYTSEDAYAEETLREMLDKASIQINTLEREIERLNGIVSRNASEINEYRLKISAVEGYISDYYSENGDMLDELKDVADYLGIAMTKKISGTATFEISWNATVPLDFDASDFEISFDVSSYSDEAEDFDWDEENCEVDGSDDDY